MVTTNSNNVVVVALLLIFAAAATNSFSLFGGSDPKPVPVKNVKGRLLTAEEGCGFSKVKHKRIVGGSAAKPGKYENVCVDHKKQF